MQRHSNPARLRRLDQASFARSPSTSHERLEVPFVQVRLERVDDQTDGFFQPLGFYSRLTRSLAFWAAAVDLMGEDVLASLIAHELAHAFNHAAGTMTFVEDEEEEQVRQVMRGWGFNDSLIDGWVESNQYAAQAYFRGRSASG